MINGEFKMNEDYDYDVVLDTLQKHYDVLERLDKGDRDWGIMTIIRNEQRDQLQTAMKIWKEYNEQKN